MESAFSLSLNRIDERRIKCYILRGVIMRRGQSLVEYFILFALVAALSIVFYQNIRQPFQDYVTDATTKMTK